VRIDAQIEKNVVALVAQGEVLDDVYETPTLRDLVTIHIEKGYRKYILDLDRVGLIVSSFLGEILASYESIIYQEGELIIVLGQRRHMRIFQVTKIDEIITICDSIEEAKEIFL
jgi:anti-anti-sigma factor